MITPEFPPSSGIGSYVYSISKKFIERNHEITVITRGSANRSEKEVVDEIAVFRVPLLPLYPSYMDTWCFFKSIVQVKGAQIYFGSSPFASHSAGKNLFAYDNDRPYSV